MTDTNHNEKGRFRSGNSALIQAHRSVTSELRSGSDGLHYEVSPYI
jgi:hypothetical protein